MRTPAVDRAAHKKTGRADKKRLDSACTPRKRFSTRVKDQTGKSKKPLHAQPKKNFLRARSDRTGETLQSAERQQQKKNKTLRAPGESDRTGKK
jgi:hypothetical protein